MTRVAVDLARLEGVVDAMARFEQHLTRTHDQVTHRVAELAATWQGEGATAQALAQQQWTVAWDETHAALLTLRGIAAVARANYGAAVAANRRMWSS